ncbi:MAG: hypothetical protein GF418_17565, partial [Chitinivibrionales bacterium]|nr:hypothetical protein [Chitinivibrionales bacterium]MBD3397430.1 hypothetical protein [Chitinivibrionales bacterium]
MGRSVWGRRRGLLHFGRYGEILSVLARYGFGDVLSSLNLEKYVAFPRRIAGARKARALASRTSRWERIRLALEDLGPSFVKLGQFLAGRRDMLPAHITDELAKLHDSARPFDAADARTIVERELKRPLADIFAEFNDNPLASASIAQVHAATLHGGDKVAVKIQRPNIQHTISTDIDILFHMAALAERYHEYARAFRLRELVEEFERTIHRELDFSAEARHMQTFRRNFADDGRVYIPKVYGDVSTSRVLVAEIVDGVKVTDVDELKKRGIDLKRLAMTGAEITLTQIFKHGFFHGDPHPGNILVRSDSSICLLDCGAVGIIPETMRYHISGILYGVVTRDSERIVRTLVRLSQRPIDDMRSLEYEIAEFIEEYSALPIKDIRVGQVLSRFAAMVVHHNLEIIPGFYLLVRAIVTIESIGRQLDPDFNMIEHIEPHVRRIVYHNPRLKHLPFDAYFAVADLASLLRDLPFDFKDMMRMVKGGGTRIQFEHRG